MAELNKLKVTGIIVVAFALITIVGLAILGGFSKGVRLNSPADASEISIGIVGEANSVGTTGQYPFLKTATSCFNSSNASRTIPEANYTVFEGTEDGGSIILLAGSQGIENNTINCSITYLAGTSAQSAADLFIAGLVVFGTFLGIIVLALIGKFIIALMNKNKE